VLHPKRALTPHHIEVIEMTAKIVMDCLKPSCDCIILIEYDGPREADLEVFCQEIADCMKCPECSESNFVVGWKRE